MNKWLYLVISCVFWSTIGVIILRADGGGSLGEIEPCESPSRIVSMAPNLTEILFALGQEEKIVGVTRDSDYPAGAKEKARVGDFWQVDIEAVIASRPDLVITLGFERQRNLAYRLERIGYKSLAVNIDKVEDLFSAVVQIGAATSSLSEAELLLARLKENLREIRTVVEGSDPVKVLWVVQREPLRVAGRDTFVNEIIELAGGSNAVGSTVHKYPPIGPEQVVVSGTEVIIEPAMVNGELSAQQKSAVEYYGKYGNLPAVMNGRIYVIEGDIVSRLGPRLDEAVLTIGRCLRPELFRD